MAHVLRKLITDGPLKGQYENIIVSPASVEPQLSEVKLGQPHSVTMGHGKRYICSLCRRKYAALGVFAMHYQKTHADLPQEKDAWRKHVIDVAEA